LKVTALTGNDCAPDDTSGHRTKTVAGDRTKTAADRAPSGRPPINILIVDDEPKNLTVLESILDGPDYRLVRAESGEEGLLALLADEFALLILDIRMPGMSGFDLARLIRERKKTADIPIIFLTAYYNEDQHVLEGYAAGAVDYLLKPLVPAVLRAKVAAFAELWRKRRDIEVTNRALQAEVVSRRRAEDRLRALNDTLEQQSGELNQKNWQLREANEEIMAMYERGGIYLGRLTPEGILADANRTCIEGLGFVRADNIGKPFWEGGFWRISPEVEEWVHKKVEQALAGQPFRGVSSYVTGYGEERVIDITMTPIKDDADRVVSIFVAGLDITERARQYRATFENAAVGIAHASVDLRWTRVNDAMCHIIDYPVKELINKPVLDFVHPDHREALLADVGRIRDGRTDSYDAERRYLRKDGATVWVHASVSAIRKRDGSTDCFIGVIQDISARKQAEQLLRRQADLLDQSYDAILTWKIGGAISYWSRGAEAMYGYTRDEAIGRVSHDLLRTRADAPIEDVEGQIACHGFWYGELTHTTRDGHEIVVDSRHIRISYDGELYALETNRDVTERKRSEERVRLLMREANHRVKNMLSLVQVIARQTAARDPEDFADRFTERLQALAANQELLVRHRWQGIDVEDLIRAQLAPFVEVTGPRIILRGRKLRLNAAATQAIGLALHELATNASKYAFGGYGLRRYPLGSDRR
jgi:PAS domain S-box-containing protein